MTGDEQRKTALITGASSGIGAELARQFAGDQWDVILVARREEKLRELGSELEGKHAIKSHVITCDLSKTDAPTELHARVQELGVTVDALVNNAGFGLLGRFAKLDLQRQLDMVQVNVMALTHLTALFLPEMISRKRGGVLNVGSTAGFQPGPFMAVYFASKAYVLSFSEAIAEELIGTGVTVTCLAPGPTESEFGSKSGMSSSPLFRFGGTMPTESVARAGYRAFRRGKILVVPGIPNKFGTFMVRLVPRIVARKFVKIVQWPA